MLYQQISHAPWYRLAIAGAILLAIMILSFSAYTLFLAPQSSSRFFASIDTMKESRDTEKQPLSQDEISSIVNLSASIHTNYITIDTNWDYPAYMQQWISAIRATGRHIWFRSAPNQWENTNGATGIMTPQQYKSAETRFILDHPSFFQSGDIFDACPEPEMGHYWTAQFGSSWTYNAPNTATKVFNAFLRDTTDTADQAFNQKSISGIITTIRSTSAFIATNILEADSVNKFGYVTIDSYPELSITDPASAAKARVTELNTIYHKWQQPIVIGEMGYSNQTSTSDAQQKAVLQAELASISRLRFVVGTNYWVGPGSNTAGGYTYIFTKSADGWRPRPAAYTLANFYQKEVEG